jgi:hypothetical protein
MIERKGTPAGRGLWFSGAPAHEKIGGAALCNCWFLLLDNWQAFVDAQDLLMLGGGVGASVEHKFVSKLPKVKKGVQITRRKGADADFIIPDTREGWCEATRRLLESYFVTGKSWTYSTVVIRPEGTPITGFGGKASGPEPLALMISKISAILEDRAGKHVLPLDAADIMCAIGEMVVSGNVRRSAIIIIGDCWDKDYLKCKRWDLGNVPNQRAMANFSVVCDDVEDLHPNFWKSYENGEPIGIVNRKNIQKYGRMGELKKDTAIGVNPCAEATLEDHESCNLQELVLSNMESPAEFVDAARIFHRYGKRVATERFHQADAQEVVSRNYRIGTGITGCLQSPLFTPEHLDRAYSAIQEENIGYSKFLGIPPSIRTTVVKPSGTISKVFDAPCEGLHPVFSEYYIQRIRFSANDPQIVALSKAGHHIEPVVKFDGTIDAGTVVVDFYVDAHGLPSADKNFDTWKQLDTVLLAQKHWADQSCSVTVYYRKEEIVQIKEWLQKNLQYLKTISFLCHSDHGFKQAPKEAITEEQYDKLTSKIKEVVLVDGNGFELDGAECAGGFCPVK